MDFFRLADYDYDYGWLFEGTHLSNLEGHSLPLIQDPLDLE